MEIHWNWIAIVILGTALVAVASMLVRLFVSFVHLQLSPGPLRSSRL